VVNFLDKALLHADDEAMLSSIAKEINGFMQQFPLYPTL